ncbi:MAG: LysE family transporter, partial [Planctomycetes bacterium]|nr:LysE family transporter [Planctomycetota bacterium]
ELPLMLLIMAGMGGLFRRPGVRIGIGLVGGLFLLVMGGRMVAESFRPPRASGRMPSRGPVATGIVLTAGNPYFLLWWATVGLALTGRAMELGAAAFGLFAVVHWLCDLAWLEVLSWMSFRGARLLGKRAQRIVPAVCGAAMLAFGVSFGWRAVSSWLAGGA